MGFRSGRGCWLGAALGAAGALLPLFSAAGMAAPGPAVGDTPAKIRIAFAGDSIVDNYWAGVGRIIDGNACLKDAVELGRFAKNGTGPPAATAPTGRARSSGSTPRSGRRSRSCR